ncbi:MAG: nucleoside phosphorylase [Candidatus Euphemobacter frigidus]|nr:nucleoside phosphorylase [Candidatus Euphemobacter frigidus]MDP8275989.1 nucleoside phosphorylase [Candidatus Euphemobacter frigidus]
MTEKQYHIDLAPGDVGRYVLLPGDPGRAEKISRYFDNPREVAFKREFRTFTGTFEGIKVSVTSTGIGCPSAAIALEELIKVGADTFIRVGTAGSLQKEVETGHLAIATAAIREEGTTRQYIPLSYPAVSDLDVLFALRQAAEELGYPYHLGITHCKDAFYTEVEGHAAQQEFNEALWKTWLRANVISTSMEESALFVIGSLRKVRVGAVATIIGQTWAGKPIGKSVDPENAIKTALRAFTLLEGR